MDRFTKVAHFIPVKTTYSNSDVEKVFIKGIIKLHGVTNKIVSNKDENFTSKFWNELFTGFGTELAFNTTYHLQIDGQTERVNRNLEYMLRIYVMHQQWKWE